MSKRSVLASRLRALFTRGRLERELDEELRFHIEMQTEDNLRAGMDPDEARRAARRRFGVGSATADQLETPEWTEMRRRINDWPSA